MGRASRDVGAAAADVPAGRLGRLDRGDLELEGDLLADQDAAGLEGGVEADAVVAADDDDRPSKPRRVLPYGSCALPS